MTKGYVYIDNDNNINIRNKDYIEVENPSFWQDNSHLIDTVWEFDTENESLMLNIMTSFKRRELPTTTVVNFCKAINFDLQAFIKSQTSGK